MLIITVNSKEKTRYACTATDLAAYCDDPDQTYPNDS